MEPLAILHSLSVHYAPVPDGFSGMSESTFKSLVHYSFPVKIKKLG